MTITPDCDTCKHCIKIMENKKLNAGVYFYECEECHYEQRKEEDEEMGGDTDETDN